MVLLSGCNITTMVNPLRIDDFKLLTLTCELRYKNAYLIFDRTGQILAELREHFSDIEVSAASPQQTSFTSEEGTFVLELGACRFTVARADKGGEVFARQCKVYFETIMRHLDVSVLTRIGLRHIARKEFKSLEDSKSALAALGLAGLNPTKRFNSSDSPTEVLFRWEDSQIGAFLRLKAETTEIKMNVPLELRDTVQPVEKKITGLTLDIDYYTAAAVQREQWEPEEWVHQKYRIIRKEADSIMEGKA